MSVTCFPHFSSGPGDGGVLNEPPGSATTPERVLLVRDGPFGELGRHPDVAPLLKEGWSIGRIFPLGPERRKRRVLVLLVGPGES